MRVLLPISGNKPYEAMCRAHPDNLGYIIGPSYYMNPKPGIPFVLDNDAFKYWKDSKPFDPYPWFQMMDRVRRLGRKPMWCVVPDVVGDASATLKQWGTYSPQVRSFGFERAFVLQDGIQLSDVPESDIYFVGGTTEFKWNTAHYWCKHLRRVHVGRVRSRRIHHCERIGAESCDGSGWLRETVNGRPMRQLAAWLERCNHQYEFAEI